MEDAFETQARSESMRMQGAQAESQGITNAANAVNEAVRFHQELMMKAPEVKMRMAMMQSEQQLNMQKIANLQVIDQVKQSRLATERMELENEHIKAMTDQQKTMTKAAQDAEDPNKPGSMANMRHEEVLDKAYKAGWMVPGEDGKPPRVLSGAERTANEERMAKLHHATTDAQEENAATTRGKALKAMSFEIRRTVNFDTSLTPEQKKAKLDQADAIDKEANGLLGVKEPETEADRVHKLMQILEGH
jgi:hypothetical protein